MKKLKEFNRTNSELDTAYTIINKLQDRSKENRIKAQEEKGMENTEKNVGAIMDTVKNLNIHMEKVIRRKIRRGYRNDVRRSSGQELSKSDRRHPGTN